MVSFSAQKQGERQHRLNTHARTHRDRTTQPPAETSWRSRCEAPGMSRTSPCCPRYLELLLPDETENQSDQERCANLFSTSAQLPQHDAEKAVRQEKHSPANNTAQQQWDFMQTVKGSAHHHEVLLRKDHHLRCHNVLAKHPADRTSEPSRLERS